MHDNETLGKKLTTFLWIVATITPFILLFINLINAVFKGNHIIDNTTLQNYIYFNFDSLLLNINNTLNPILISSIKTTFINIFDTIGIQIASQSGIFIAIVFTWALQVQILHVVYDVLIVLFKFTHNFFDKLG